MQSFPTNTIDDLHCSVQNVEPKLTEKSSTSNKKTMTWMQKTNIWDHVVLIEKEQSQNNTMNSKSVKKDMTICEKNIQLLWTTMWDLQNLWKIYAKQTMFFLQESNSLKQKLNIWKLYIIIKNKMEKLMNLLNKFLIEINRWYTVNTRNDEYRCFDDTTETWRTINEELLIFKRFWFIERLVRRNHIDYDKTFDWMALAWTWWSYSFSVSAFTKKTWKQIQSDRVLMILSLQDEPVEFLLSILK